MSLEDKMREVTEEELRILGNALEEKGELNFPISNAESRMMQIVVNNLKSGKKLWLTKKTSGTLNETYEGYRNVLCFIEYIGLEKVELSATTSGVKVSRNLTSR